MWRQHTPAHIDYRTNVVIYFDGNSAMKVWQSLLLPSNFYLVLFILFFFRDNMTTGETRGDGQSACVIFLRRPVSDWLRGGDIVTATPCLSLSCFTSHPFFSHSYSYVIFPSCLFMPLGKIEPFLSFFSFL